MAKSDRDHAIRLLALADDDLLALRNMQDAAQFSEGIFGFLAQQAIEKRLKAWLALSGLAYPKTHDLSSLAEMLRSASIDLSDFEGLGDYTVFAAQYRYQAYGRTNGKLDRRATVMEVDGLITHVRALIAGSA